MKQFTGQKTEAVISARIVFHYCRFAGQNSHDISTDAWNIFAVMQNFLLLISRFFVEYCLGNLLLDFTITQPKKIHGVSLRRRKNHKSHLIAYVLAKPALAI